MLPTVATKSWQSTWLWKTTTLECSCSHDDWTHPYNTLSWPILQFWSTERAVTKLPISINAVFWDQIEFIWCILTITTTLWHVRKLFNGMQNNWIENSFHNVFGKNYCLGDDIKCKLSVFSFKYIKSTCTVVNSRGFFGANVLLRVAASGTIILRHKWIGQAVANEIGDFQRQDRSVWTKYFLEVRLCSLTIVRIPWWLANFKTVFTKWFPNPNDSRVQSCSPAPVASLPSTTHDGIMS